MHTTSQGIMEPEIPSENCSYQFGFSFYDLFVVQRERLMGC